jgi:hypothetical protein
VAWSLVSFFCSFGSPIAAIPLIGTSGLAIFLGVRERRRIDQAMPPKT